MSEASARVGSAWRWGGAAALLALLVAGIRAFSYAVDDAYIFQRFARNALAGQGLVYNAGERVEGFTSPLWMALHLALQALGFDSLLAPQLLGVAATVALVFVLLRAPRVWGEPPGPWDLVAPALVVSSIGTLAYAGSAMETPFYVLLVTAVLVRRVRELREGDALPLSGLLCALAFLTRPEGAVVAALCALSFVPELRRGALSRALQWVLIAGLPVLALLVARWLYYADWLPNTYYAKQLPVSQTLQIGASYLVSWLVALSGWPLLAWIAAFALRGRLARELGVLIAGAAALLLAPVAMPGDWMPFHRFLLPALPVCALCAQEAARVALRESLARRLVLAALALVVALQLRVVLHPDTQALLASHRHDVERWVALGDALKPHVDADDLVVLGPAGAIAAAIPSRVIDFYGLVDRHIARAPIADLGALLPGHMRSDAAYLMSLEPDVIVPALVERDQPVRDVREMQREFWSHAQRDVFAHPDLAHYRPLNLRYAGAWITVLERAP